MSDQARTLERKAPLPTYAWVCFGLSGLVGLVGLTIVGFALLLRMRPPQTVPGQCWRIMGLSTCGTAMTTGAMGGVVGVVRGWDYPPTRVFAFIEGGIIGGVPGLLLGALVGAVLVLAHIRRAGRA